MERNKWKETASFRAAHAPGERRTNAEHDMKGAHRGTTTRLKELEGVPFDYRVAHGLRSTGLPRADHRAKDGTTGPVPPGYGPRVPSTVASVMAAVELEPGGRALWGEAPPDEPGVYVVALGPAIRSRAAALAECPVSLPAIGAWIQRRGGEMRLDGKPAAADEVARRMQELWLPDEVVLYIGKADASLLKRVGAYYTTKLGKRRPHAGGRFLKTLTLLDELWVHYATCNEPEEKEAEMLRAFIDSVSKKSSENLRDPRHPFPFANLEWRARNSVTGRRRRLVKDHGLKKDVEPKRERV